MSDHKNDSLYLHHIIQAIAKIEDYTAKLDYTSFRASGLVQDGVIRQLEIVGEATKHLSPHFKKRHGILPWKDIAGMRDKLIHDYFGVDIEAVWETVKNDIPIMKTEINKYIKNFIE